MRLTLTAILIVSAIGRLSSQSFEKLICFEEGAYTLGEEGSQSISEVCSFLKENPSSYLKIFGYATQVGSEESNIQLSKRRAESVYEAISNSCVIDENKVYVTWIGESLETYDLHYDKAHANQPCVDIIILK